MSTMTKRTMRRRKTQQTTLLQQLPINIQQAYYQELLDQSALFRQIAAASNGVTGPIERNVIAGTTETAEVTEEQEDIQAEEGKDKQPENPLPVPAPTTTAEPSPVIVEKEDKQPENPSPVPVPAATAEPSPVVQELLDRESKRFKQLLAAGAGAVLISTLLATGTLRWFSPAATDPAATENNTAVTSVIETDQQLLEILGRTVYDDHSTSLSNAASEAYNYDPELRIRHIQELQRVFDEEL